MAFWSSVSSTIMTEQQLLSGHDEPLDLLRALVDLTDLGISHVTLHRILTHVSVSTEELHRLIGYRHGRLSSTWDALVSKVRGLEHQTLGRLDLRRHVRDRKLDSLEVGDWFAELPPLLDVGHCLLERGPGNADCLCGDADTAGVQRVHGDLEAHALLTQPVGGRYFDVVKHNVSGR